MRYRFNEFEFNNDTLLLTNNGVTQAIRNSEAKVLALLLAHADNVLSKEDILSHVWQHKIVSEQVVFQNISNLRNRFGNNAIKTFPKRGYQWQLITDVFSPEIHYPDQSQISQKTLESSPYSHLSTSAKKQPFWRLALIACLFVITIGVLYSQNKHKLESTDSVIKLAYIPITELNNKSIKFNDNNDFDVTELTHLTTEKFEDLADIEYPKLSNTHPFILTGKFRTYQQQTYLDFTLKGPASDWHGQLSNSSKQEGIQHLQQHLSQQVIYDLISKAQPPEVRQAKLSIAHQTSPKDLIILRELSISYFMTNELEKAMAMADKLIQLAQQQNMPQQMGRALAYQSKILTRMKLYDLSAQKLKLAMDQFEKINDLKYLARAWYYQAWLDDQHNNYVAMKASLLKSVQLAVAAQNKLGEIDTLIHLAGKAHYYQKEEDKYFYLQQAEDKITAYQLPHYHLAKISYRYATFAKALSEKEPHLKQVLKLTELAPENWVAQSSRRKLVQYYIAQYRLEEAQALIDQTTLDNSNNSYLKTLMAQAKQQTNEMISQAQRTFEQAQLAGDRSLSLDVALLLCNQAVNCDFYSQYINDNATEQWRTANETKQLTHL